MFTANGDYRNLQGNYLFYEVGKRARAYAEKHPDADIIRMGIGDVTEPLPPACIAAMHKAVDEMASRETFRGYGPEQGYAFLREAIAQNDFQARGADIAADEIFVSDGARGSVTSPIPRRMTFASGWAAWWAATRWAISAKR